MVETELKQFGLCIEESEPEAYVLGGMGGLPKIVLQDNGDWSDFLPVYEPQFNANFDSHGCAVFGSENAIEILLKRIEGKEYNFSERFIYILSGIRPPGGDPHKVIEIIRRNGLIENDSLPFTDSFTEFLTPDPMEAKYLVEAAKFPYDLQHEYLWKGEKSIDEKRGIIKECLRYSPIGLAVTAWIKNEKGEYIDGGKPNTHWCVGIKVDSEDRIHVFDSYDQSVKILSKDHHFQIAKRFLLTSKELKPKKNWLQDAFSNLGSFLKDLLVLLVS